MYDISFETMKGMMNIAQQVRKADTGYIARSEVLDDGYSTPNGGSQPWV